MFIHLAQIHMLYPKG